MNRGYQTASKKHREQNMESPSESSSSTAGRNTGGLPDLSQFAGMFGGGAGRGGGMPDLQNLMSNPMLMNMANQMAQSGAFDSLMNNPRMREMAQQMMSGERNMGDLLNDPEVQNMYTLSPFSLFASFWTFGVGRGILAVGVVEVVDKGMEVLDHKFAAYIRDLSYLFHCYVEAQIIAIIETEFEL